MFWECWGEEGARDQEHVALVIGGRVGDPRVRSGPVILPLSLRISEPQFPQLRTGGYGTCQPRLTAPRMRSRVGEHSVSSEVLASGKDCQDLLTAVSFSGPWQPTNPGRELFGVNPKLSLGIGCG